MSSVNKIFTFLFISIFSSSLFAIDVSNFDIKGIKLGMSKNKVSKKLSCSSQKINFIPNTKKIINYEIECDYGIRIFLNYKKQAYFIQRSLIFQNKPLLNTINKKIFNKYGKPNISIARSDNHIEYCYGNKCKKEKFNFSTSGKSLTVSISIEDNSVLTKFKNSILFNLQDKIMEESVNKREMRLYEQQRKQESNIDL